MDAFPAWFPSARLNFAENALWCKDPTKTAIIATGELQSKPQRISYADLYSRVRQCAKAMRRAGVVKGDRVAGYIANCPEAIIAMLAASSIGAIWSSTSPDFGTIVSERKCMGCVVRTIGRKKEEIAPCMCIRGYLSTFVRPVFSALLPSFAPPPQVIITFFFMPPLE